MCSLFPFPIQSANTEFMLKKRHLVLSDILINELRVITLMSFAYCTNYELLFAYELLFTVRCTN